MRERESGERAKEQRRHARRPQRIFAWCTITPPHGSLGTPAAMLRVAVADVSPGGLRLRTPLPVGDVRVELPGGIVLDMSTAWVREGRFGATGLRLRVVLAGRDAYEVLAGAPPDEDPEAASSSGVHARTALVPAPPGKTQAG